MSDSSIVSIRNLNVQAGNAPILKNINLEIARNKITVLLGPSAWVLLLRHNKPEGYAGDWIDQRVNGEGWAYTPRTQPVPPGKERHA